MPKRILVFGVFDFLHPGHCSFLREARKHGRELIVIVARDSTVFASKGKRPRQREGARIRRVRALPGVEKAVFGDARFGTYRVLRRFLPDVICFGYDQALLEKDVRARMRKGDIPKARLVRLSAYKPHRFKSSKGVNYPPANN